MPAATACQPEIAMRVVKPYRGHVVKAWLTTGKGAYEDFPAEWKVVKPDGSIQNCGTSFQTLASAMGDARHCVDVLIEQAPRMERLSTACGYVATMRIVNQCRKALAERPRFRFS